MNYCNISAVEYLITQILSGRALNVNKIYVNIIRGHSFMTPTKTVQFGNLPTPRISKNE